MIPYKDIGDNLTVNEFNGVISLLRDNINFEENLTINNSTVKGQYAEYVFDFQEATVLDNGILITNETLSNIGTVKLTKAVFPHSNYFIDLKVYSSTDVGISDMDHTDYIVTELSIPLRHNAEVNIPFETLEMDNIISFDAKIRINHKDLIIRGTSYINLTTDISEVGWNKPVTFTARYLDDAGIPIPEAQINFYNGETLLDTATTDEDGYASISHSFNVLGSYTVFATCEAITSNNVSVTVVKNTSTLVLSANTNSAFVGMSVNVTGSLKDGTIAMGNKSVELYNGATLLETLTTGSDGSFSTTVTMPSADVSLLAVYTDSTGHYTDATSQNVVIQKVTEYTEVTFEGTTFSPITTASSPNFIGNNGNVIIDYGDGTISVSNNYNHTYSTSGEHTIKIYNATALNSSCFQEVTGITDVTLSNQITSINAQAFFGCGNLESIDLGSSLISIGNACFDSCSFESITIPNTVTTIGNYCFRRTYDKPFLKEIILNWDNSSDIVYYNSTWISGVDGFEHFLIPQGTTSLYTAEGYPSNLLVEDVSYTDIVGSTNKPILSYADGDKATLYAQLVDGQGQSVAISNVEITFKVGSTILGSAFTDNTGKATLTDGYTSVGAGDVRITVTDGISVTERYDIQDCSYYNTAEVTRSSTNGSTIYDNSLSQALPSKCEISLDIWSDNTNTGEHRFFIMPKTQYSSGTTQPQYAIYFDMLRNNQMAFGKRENNSSQSVGFPSVTATSGTYHTVKFVKDETSISVYVDDNLIGSFILSWIDNYTDYCMSMMRWSASGTSKIKNVKFKPL